MPLLLVNKFHPISDYNFSEEQFIILFGLDGAFFTWFGIEREIEEDNYFRHTISKHADIFSVFTSPSPQPMVVATIIIWLGGPPRIIL